MSDDVIYTAASGALVQQARMEILSNNLANINTVGYKEDRAVFKNYMPGDQNRIDSINPDLSLDVESESIFPYLSVNSQVRFEGTKTNFEQGPLKQSGNQLDFAISGDGFFCIENSDGHTKYTRNGNFTINEEGILVNHEGMVVLSKNGNEISVKGKDISVDVDGRISVDGIPGDTIKIVDFDTPYSLIKEGDSLFAPANETVKEMDATNYQVRQGFNELSNVDPIKVMTEMIEVHRAFESYQKIIRSTDETVSRSLNEIGRAV